jgi:hypothetical protein
MRRPVGDALSSSSIAASVKRVGMNWIFLWQATGDRLEIVQQVTKPGENLCSWNDLC